MKNLIEELEVILFFKEKGLNVFKAPFMAQSDLISNYIKN